MSVGIPGHLKSNIMKNSKLVYDRVARPAGAYVKEKPVSAAIEGGLLLAGGWQVRSGMALTRLGVKSVQAAAKTGRVRRGVKQIQKGGRKVVSGRRKLWLSGIEIGFDPNIPIVPHD